MKYNSEKLPEGVARPPVANTSAVVRVCGLHWRGDVAYTENSQRKTKTLSTKANSRADYQSDFLVPFQGFVERANHTIQEKLSSWMKDNGTKHWSKTCQEDINRPSRDDLLHKLVRHHAWTRVVLFTVTWTAGEGHLGSRDGRIGW